MPKLTSLQKIKKELEKLEALHAKEEAIVEKIEEVINEAENEEQMPNENPNTK